MSAAGLDWGERPRARSARMPTPAETAARITQLMQERPPGEGVTMFMFCASCPDPSRLNESCCQFDRAFYATRCEEVLAARVGFGLRGRRRADLRRRIARLLGQGATKK